MVYIYDALCLVCVLPEQNYEQKYDDDDGLFEQKYEHKEFAELDTFTKIIHGLIKVQDSVPTYRYNKQKQ